MIKVAKALGSAFGVDRAVNLVLKDVEAGRPVATLGPLSTTPAGGGIWSNRAF